MKKTIALLLTLLTVLSLFAACGKKDSDDGKTDKKTSEAESETSASGSDDGKDGKTSKETSDAESKTSASSFDYTVKTNEDGSLSFTTAGIAIPIPAGFTALSDEEVTAVLGTSDGIVTYVKINDAGQNMNSIVIQRYDENARAEFDVVTKEYVQNQYRTQFPDQDASVDDYQAGTMNGLTVKLCNISMKDLAVIDMYILTESSIVCVEYTLMDGTSDEECAAMRASWTGVAAAE